MFLPYPLDKYHRITSLYNRRLEIEFDDHTLVVDKNTYKDEVDYNLEIESKLGIDHAKELLIEYAKKFNLGIWKPAALRSGNSSPLSSCSRVSQHLLEKVNSSLLR